MIEDEVIWDKSLRHPKVGEIVHYYYLDHKDIPLIMTLPAIVLSTGQREKNGKQWVTADLCIIDRNGKSKPGHLEGSIRWDYFVPQGYRIDGCWDFPHESDHWMGELSAEERAKQPTQPDKWLW